MIGTAYVSNPPLTVEEGEAWLRELVQKIDMVILIEPQTVLCEDLGNEGVTGIVGLKTSHASFHSWSSVDEPFLNFDIYSCKTFDAQTVVDHLAQFGLLDIKYVVLDRNHGINEIERRGT